MKGPLDNARVLLAKASHDIIMAELALADGRVLDAGCFHTQQAAEKSLKALLAADDVEYPLTHNLRVLADLVEGTHPQIRGAVEAAVPLSRFAVEIRYADTDQPNAEQATAALDTARWLFGLAEEIIREREPVDRGEDADEDEPS